MWIIDRPPTGPKSPDTPQSIAAFADFAVAAVRRYRQRGVIFELWNVRSLSLSAGGGVAAAWLV